MPETDFMKRVEEIIKQTGCTREHAMQAVAATGLQPARSEITKAQRVLLRARLLMRNKGYGWSRAIDLAAETVE